MPKSDKIIIKSNVISVEGADLPKSKNISVFNISVTGSRCQILVSASN